MSARLATFNLFQAHKGNRIKRVTPDVIRGEHREQEVVAHSDNSGSGIYLAQRVRPNKIRAEHSEQEFLSG
ncbi:hypothetical protein Pan153_22210 [Gimesia panareensis]|uniref:Uncharacterized protein n=1 Tax=Gimesia panareensis TaxID=2527978 RepID=A0A518FMH7_9PLAN|nr:hypothetical protein Pan153_22210 [Gimesia panareensis]